MAYGFNEDRSKAPVYTKAEIDANYDRVYETVADMQADTDLAAGMIARTLGFHSAGDGGAAYYKIASSGTANGMDVLACGNSLFANMVITGDSVTPEMFGAYGDGEHDDSGYINRALSISNVVHLGNEYLISSPLLILDDIKLKCSGVINYSGDNAAIILKGHDAYIDIQYLNSNNIGVVIDPDNGLNLSYGNKINCGRLVSDSHCIYFNPISNNSKAVQYCEFYGTYTSNNGNCIHVEFPQNSQGWFNENSFYDVKLISKNGYAIYHDAENTDGNDGNYFENVSPEGSKYFLYLNKVRNIIFNSPRLEEISIINGPNYKFITLENACDEIYFNNVYMYMTGFENLLSNNNYAWPGFIKFTGKLLNTGGDELYESVVFVSNKVSEIKPTKQWGHQLVNKLSGIETYPSLENFSFASYMPAGYIVNDTTIIIPDEYFKSGQIFDLFYINRFSIWSAVTVQNEDGTKQVAISNDGNDKRLVLKCYVCNENIILE